MFPYNYGYNAHLTAMYASDFIRNGMSGQQAVNEAIKTVEYLNKKLKQEKEQEKS